MTFSPNIQVKKLGDRKINEESEREGKDKLNEKHRSGNKMSESRIADKLSELSSQSPPPS